MKPPDFFPDNIHPKISILNRVVIILAGLAGVLFICALFIVVNIDYRAVTAVYNGLLTADLLKRLALVSVLFALIIITWHWCRFNKVFTKLTYLICAFSLVVIGLNVYFSIPLVRDLRHRPVEHTGHLTNKTEAIAVGGGLEYQIRLDTMNNMLIMAGDNLENGYTRAIEGDYVSVWYGPNTRRAFYIRKIYSE